MGPQHAACKFVLCGQRSHLWIMDMPQIFKNNYFDFSTRGPRTSCQYRLLPDVIRRLVVQVLNTIDSVHKTTCILRSSSVLDGSVNNTRDSSR